MMQLLRPKYIQELAALLDVKAAPEWALPYALGSAPLPEGWTHLISDDGDVLFVNNMRPQAPQREHPLLDRAAQALAQLRANGAGGSEAQMLGPFENLESPAVEYFYFDVRTGQQVPEFECPPGAIIQPLQSDILQLLTEPGPAPSGLELQQQQQQQQQRQDQEHPIGQEAYTEPGALEANMSVDENAAALKESGSAGPDVGSEIGGWGPDAAVSAEEARVAGEGPGGGGPVDTATPASIGVRTSRPQSASSSRNGNLDNAAAAGVATGFQSPGSSGSASKLPRRQGSDRDAGSWQETGGASGSSAGAAPVAAAAVPDMRAMPASSGASPTQPAPPPPGVRLAAAAVATVGSSKSLGLGSDDHNNEDNDEVTYMRGESTTAGYAGSVSENSSGSRISGGGIGVGIGNSRGGRNSGSGRSNGSVASGSGSGSDGSRSIGEALSRSGSNRSSETVGSERNSEGRIGAGNSTNGGKAAGGIGGRAPVPPPSGRLTFYGWWFEDIESPDLTFRIDTNPTAGGGLAPRHCNLVYDFTTSSYIFTMRDPVTPPAPGQPHERVPVLTVPGICGDQVAMCDTGRPADLWDLHLGARLRVLGRQVILKNSDLATAQWHANYFKQLCVLRDKLHQEVQKYKPRVIRPGLVADKGDVRLQTGQQLRHVVLQVRELVEDLRQYRPNKAESFMAALPIQL